MLEVESRVSGVRILQGASYEPFPILQLRCVLILRELNQIYNGCLQEQSFFLQTLLFTAFLVTVLITLTYALVST